MARFLLIYGVVACKRLFIICATLLCKRRFTRLSKGQQFSSGQLSADRYGVTELFVNF
jgi:hypothetical protein